MLYFEKCSLSVTELWALDEATVRLQLNIQADLGCLSEWPSLSSAAQDAFNINGQVQVTRPRNEKYEIIFCNSDAYCVLAASLSEFFFCSLSMRAHL